MSLSDTQFKKIYAQLIGYESIVGTIPISIERFESGSNYTYSMPGYNLYVMDPDYDTRAHETILINRVESNIKLTKTGVTQ